MKEEIQFDELILTTEQLAEWLQMSPAKIYSWAKKGLIPHFRIGRNIRFRYSDILEWLETVAFVAVKNFERRLEDMS